MTFAELHPDSFIVSAPDVVQVGSISICRVICVYELLKYKSAGKGGQMTEAIVNAWPLPFFELNLN